MAATESDFSGFSDTAGGGDLKVQWPDLARSVQALAAYFVAKVANGTEPSDVLAGIMLGLDGQSTNHQDWRIYADSGGDLILQENTGSEAAPTWTARATFTAGGGGTLPTHASAHQHSGADEIATATPAANAIPKADGSGKLDSWITAGVTDHGALTGLSDDDHTIYVLATGARNITGTQKWDNGANAAFTAIQISAGLAADQNRDIDFLGFDDVMDWRIRVAQAGHYELYRGATKVMDLRSTAGANTLFSDTNGVGIGGSSASGAALNVTGQARADTMGTDNANEWDTFQGAGASSISSSSGTLTVDCSARNLFKTTLTENVTTITLTNTGADGHRRLIITQDAVTPRTVAWPVGWLWANGIEPTMSSGTGDVDIYDIYIEGGVIYASVYGQAFA